jgi:hypothetical protein
MKIFERWIFWLVLKLEISYNRVIISFLKDFGCFQRFFWRLCFLHGWKYLSFHSSSSFFSLRYLFNVKFKGSLRLHQLLPCKNVFLFQFFDIKNLEKLNPTFFSKICWIYTRKWVLQMNVNNSKWRDDKFHINIVCSIGGSPTNPHGSL